MNDDQRRLLRDALLVQESGRELRHSLRNHLAAMRNAVFFVERRLRATAAEVFESDPRVEKMLVLIDSEMRETEAILTPDPRSAAILDAARGLCDAAPVIRAVLDARVGTGARITSEIGEGLAVRASEALLSIAVSGLLDDALSNDASAGCMVRASRADDGFVAIRVSDSIDRPAPSPDDPHGSAFEARADGSFGVGLACARRATLVWEGRIEVAANAPRGRTVTLLVPTPSRTSLVPGPRS